MKPCLRIALAVSLSGLASCAAAQGPAPAAAQTRAIDLAAQLSALDGADQSSPETLNGRLAYAERLLETADGDCRSRVEAAQRQLDTVIAKPAFSVVMPLGAARAANIDYDIHAARGVCSAQTPEQQTELSAARDAALRAAGLYRDGFDYQSMAVMQFDAAVAARQLGDRAGAVTLLRSAIEMDATYGFQKDAADNETLLRQWTGDGPALAPTNGAPNRSAVLKFAWSAKDADVAVAASYTTVIDDKIVASHGAAARTLSIRADGSDWMMSFPSNTRTFDFDGWPKGPADQELSTLLLANIRLASPSFRVSAAGDFKSVVDPDKIKAKLAAETTRLTSGVMTGGDGGLASMPQLETAVKYVSAPDQLAAMAAEDHELTTADWIGATLDQGTWYDMTAPLRAPGTTYVLDHDIQFAYTRPVPCTAVASTAACVEIVLHATPNPVALGQWISYMSAQFGLRSQTALHYWAATDIRIVTDPSTLLPYGSDVRRYWYLSADGPKKDNRSINSERIVSTATYR